MIASSIKRSGQMSIGNKTQREPKRNVFHSNVRKHEDAFQTWVKKHDLAVHVERTRYSSCNVDKGVLNMPCNWKHETHKIFLSVL